MFGDDIGKLTTICLNWGEPFSRVNPQNATFILHMTIRPTLYHSPLALMAQQAWMAHLA